MCCGLPIATSVCVINGRHVTLDSRTKIVTEINKFMQHVTLSDDQSTTDNTTTANDKTTSSTTSIAADERMCYRLPITMVICVINDGHVTLDSRTKIINETNKFMQHDKLNNDQSTTTTTNANDKKNHPQQAQQQIKGCVVDYLQQHQFELLMVDVLH